MQQTTLIIFKPDSIQKNLVGEILARFQKEGFAIAGTKMIKMTDELLRDHYAHVLDKPFFPGLVSYMTSSPVIVLALRGEEVINRVREMLGPTDSQKAPKGTLRGDYGEDVTVNLAHASDSPETARVELARFFAQSEIF